MSARRTIFIGDVHGCRTELEEMLSALQLRPDDRVIMLGDLINRGPDSAGVVKLVYNAGFECLMGNHEEEYLHLYQDEEKYKNLRQVIGREMHSWIEARPLYIEENEFLAVHAGLQPGLHPKDTRRDILLNIRTWDGRGRDIRNPDNPPWYNFYNGTRPIFYGHWARKGLNLRDTTFGLDSGCVYGRALSAYILEEKKLIQIPARTTYYIPPSMRKSASAR